MIAASGKRTIDRCHVEAEDQSLLSLAAQVNPMETTSDSFPIVPIVSRQLGHFCTGDLR